MPETTAAPFKPVTDLAQLPYRIMGQSGKDTDIRAAFRSPHDQHAFEMMGHLQDLHDAPRELIERLRKRTAYARMGGYENEIPYDQFIALMEAAVAEAKELRDHTCEFGSDNYCRVCHRDGNI